ncbi:MAG: hypothetical protein GY789_20685 [Hyphomicrobiales bacterium]|nr:hypothetical protein [Hyphomicrobiales bacterium]
MSATEIGKNVFAAIGIAAIGVVGTIGSGAFGYWNTDRNQDIQMVNIALSILGGENKDTSFEGRMFALYVLEKYADVKINNKAEWATSGTLPKDIYVPGYSGGGGAGGNGNGNGNGSGSEDGCVDVLGIFGSSCGQGGSAGDDSGARNRN